MLGPVAEVEGLIQISFRSYSNRSVSASYVKVVKLCVTEGRRTIRAGDGSSGVTLGLSTVIEFKVLRVVNDSTVDGSGLAGPTNFEVSLKVSRL